MNVNVTQDIAIRDIDLVAILANLFENAIHGCEDSGLEQQEINIYIAQKGNKAVIRFSNTSTKKVSFRKGLPKSDRGGGLGASRYGGEATFEQEDGKFVTKVLLYLLEEPCPARQTVQAPGD